MPRVVLVGKGRRLTLSELYHICHEDGLLQWQPTGGQPSAGPEQEETKGNQEVNEKLQALQEAMQKQQQQQQEESSSFLWLTPSETRGFLALLAWMIAQQQENDTKDDNNKQEQVASLLLDLLNAQQQHQVTSSFRLAVTVLDDSSVQLHSEMMLVEHVDARLQEWLTCATMVDRAVSLSVTALATEQAWHMAQAALPVAALTVDTSGYASLLLSDAVACFSEQAFDVQRPHRSMIQAAAVLRAFLNESRFKTTTQLAPVQQKMAAWAEIPQYHGPAVEDIRAAYKRLELELNSTASTASTTTTEKTDMVVSQLPLETTVLDLVHQSIMNALERLEQKSLQRQQQQQQPQDDDAALKEDPKQPPSVVPQPAWKRLSTAVHQLQSTLEREAQQAIRIVQQETARATAEQQQKAAKQQQPQAGPGGNTKSEEDEFAGKTEAQKAKILKIRAEKAAKAAAKAKAKEQKGVSLFGAGTLSTVQILTTASKNTTVDATADATTTALMTKPGSLLNATTTTALMELMDQLLRGGVQRKPKIPKGTRDYLPEQMLVRQQAFSIIRRVFESHGAVEIDTPVFELKDTLTGKYGEDSKLIYDLADQGGELLALRYDLTVPFARFLALNSVGNIKRFHIGKVYRRDQPALKRGRYREFYQCDFDIAGTYARMVPDSECLAVVCDILHALPIGDFAIKLNHRRLLDAILDLCGVPAEKFRTICSAVDKLDKEEWSAVKREMVQEKGLAEHVADQIGTFVLRKGDPWTLYKELMDSNQFGNHAGAKTALEDLRILFEYLEAMDKLKFMSFDLSLARGLDYYTGVIYEAVCMSGNTQVGSIGGGGRYDHLVSMFQEAGKETPCVGVSVGIERVFTLMEERLRQENKNGNLPQPHVSVWIAAAGGGTNMMVEKMKLARLLWDSNISAEFSQQENSKLKRELPAALEKQIPFMVILGEAELAQQKCNVKDLQAKTEDVVDIANLVSFLRGKGVIPVGWELAAADQLLVQQQQLSK